MKTILALVSACVAPAGILLARGSCWGDWKRTLGLGVGIGGTAIALQLTQELRSVRPGPLVWIATGIAALDVLGVLWLFVGW